VKALLFLLLIAALGAAGYEFYLQQTAQADYIEKRQEYVGQITQLTAQNKQLQEENDQQARDLAQPH
jgi:uncharacterized protein HemX